MQTKLLIVAMTSLCTYLCTYFFNLSMEYSEQYLAVIAVLWLDGVFGIWAGALARLVRVYLTK